MNTRLLTALLLVVLAVVVRRPVMELVRRVGRGTTVRTVRRVHGQP